MYNIFFFFRKSYRLWDNLEKYRRTLHATGDNMAHAMRMRHIVTCGVYGSTIFFQIIS